MTYSSQLLIANWIAHTIITKEIQRRARTFQARSIRAEDRIQYRS